MFNISKLKKKKLINFVQNKYQGFVWLIKNINIIAVNHIRKAQK